MERDQKGLSKEADDIQPSMHWCYSKQSSIKQFIEVTEHT
jgi:hypothetical protein